MTDKSKICMLDLLIDSFLLNLKTLVVNQNNYISIYSYS